MEINLLIPPFFIFAWIDLYCDVQYEYNAALSFTVLLSWLATLCFVSVGLDTFVSTLRNGSRRIKSPFPCVTPCLWFSPVLHRFPLYSRGERFHFEYGVYLLNKNIAQVIYKHTWTSQMFATNVCIKIYYDKIEDLRIMKEEKVTL